MYLYNALWLFRFRGLVLELGHSMSEVVPVFQVGSCGFMRSETPFLLCIPAQGYAVPEASVCCRAAGETASIRLMELIRDSENWKNYQSGVTDSVARRLKETMCLFAGSPTESQGAADAGHDDVKMFELPDGTVLTVEPLLRYGPMEHFVRADPRGCGDESSNFPPGVTQADTVVAAVETALDLWCV
eukprot:GHVU01142994.1.p1 GENE.GHVU01142994.1~~GHVU01142994.1.p1  ORF type:complete len:187 (-),score=13.07 GHVU01142994.1:60-620(-)